MKIAIWGATGNVGQALMHEASFRGINCHGYVRDVERASNLLPKMDCFLFEDFQGKEYDILVNAVAASASNPFYLFETFEKYDYMMIDYARANPSSVCISISSGATYGTSFFEPPDKDTTMSIAPNQIKPQQRYGLIKLLCEQRHRALAPLPIIDLRLFAFFTRYINLKYPFFLVDIINSVKEKKPLITTKTDFERDYIHPSDFMDVILLSAKSRKNACYDLYSKAPVKKSEIIEYFQKEYGLAVEYGQVAESRTGSKSKYFSQNYMASSLGYKPKFSSMDTIASETAAIMEALK